MPAETSRTSLLLNIAIYYIGWIACVSGAATGNWRLGALIGLALFAGHLALTREPVIEAALAVTVVFAGMVVDSVQTALGLLVFDAGQPHPALAPLWIGVMWLLFAATLRYAFHWLAGRPLVAAALGAIGGPAAFYAGMRIGAISFHPRPGLSLTVLAVGWTALLPLLMLLAEKISAGTGGRYRYFDP